MPVSPVAVGHRADYRRGLCPSFGILGMGGAIAFIVGSIMLMDTELPACQIARQAEAERSRRAKVIHALGEQEASEQLLKAAQTLAQQPQAIQLRYMQTLTEIAGQHSHTIVFPLPVDLFSQFQDWASKAKAGSKPQDEEPV